MNVVTDCIKSWRWPMNQGDMYGAVHGIQIYIKACAFMLYLIWSPLALTVSILFASIACNRHYTRAHKYKLYLP